MVNSRSTEDNVNFQMNAIESKDFYDISALMIPENG